MPLRRLFMVAGCVICTVLSGCGRPKSFDSVSVRGPMHTQQLKNVNVTAAGDEALSFRRELVAFIAAGIHAKEQPLSLLVEPSSVVSPPTLQTTVPAATSIDWPCVATAETGSDWTMHGSTYSTAYGLINEIVREYASPEVQAKVFAGTASEAEQTDIVVRFAADHGTGGWGEFTRSKCNL